MKVMSAMIFFHKKNTIKSQAQMADSFKRSVHSSAILKNLTEFQRLLVRVMTDTERLIKSNEKNLKMLARLQVETFAKDDIFCICQCGICYVMQKYYNTKAKNMYGEISTHIKNIFLYIILILLYIKVTFSLLKIQFF